jgi:hypothetical protein
MLLTYEQQLNLVKQKLATVSRNEELGLDTFKYHRRVMYDYLWKKHPEVMECRGHTYDIHTGELVLAAPTKSFNYLEDGYWEDKPLDTSVKVFKKINGYMATLAVRKGNVIVGTTGSTKSDYAKWAKELLLKDLPDCYDWDDGRTWLFEICVPQDPHIVQEKFGSHYLGYRQGPSNSKFYAPGEYVPVGHFVDVMTLSAAIKLAKTDRGEGFMLYDSNMQCCKLKTPYYVGKKKLMRLSQSNTLKMYSKGVVDGLPEMWEDAVSAVVKAYNAQGWIDTDEQDRRKFLEQLKG